MDNYYEDLIQEKARAAAKKIEEKDPEFAKKMREHLAPAKKEESLKTATEDVTPTQHPQRKIDGEVLRDAARHEKSLTRGIPPEDQ